VAPVTFTQVQNGTAVTASTGGGLTTLALTLPAASTAGTLIVACIVTGQAGTPMKISVVNGANPNTSPGWEWCCTAPSNVAGGGGQQTEIWCYRKNPGGITSTTWTIPTNDGARGHLMEFSTTLAYQVMELFPGINASVTPGATSLPASMANPVSSGELAIAMFGDNFSPGTAVTWTTPGGWTLGRTTSTQTLGMHWMSCYQVTAAAGSVSVTAVTSTSTNQVSWENAVVVFREAASVRSRVGASCSKGTYNDQSSFGFPSSKTGSAKEFDAFIGRTMSQSAQVSYQQEGDHLTGTPVAGGTGSDLVELSAMGAQICWAMKPRRTGLSGFTTVAAEQAAVDSDLTFVKQSGTINGFICTSYNEYNLGGGNGAFGNDTYKNGPDPYGNVGTGATASRAAQTNWLQYWANYQPIYAAHGIPVYTKPSYASAPSCSSWHPPAGTVSGVMADFYYSDSAGKTVYLDVSPGSDPGTGNTAPSLQDVCDGVRNADNSSASNAAIPLGIGEIGRSGGGTTPAWSLVVAWSHTGGSTGHVRDLFAARLTANKQNAPILWFENALGAPNWIHTPGANGEDQSGIQAELAAWVDNLAPQAAGTTVVVTTTSLPNAAPGVAYSQSLQVTGGAAPYTWALLTGALPTSLSLSAAGVISGTPTVAGTYTFTVKATDAGANIGNSGTLSILVPGIAITTTSVNPASIGVPYTQTLTESGGTGPFTWSTSADSVLPAGITLSSAGVLSGTTGDVPGPYGFTAIVTDSLSNVATAALTLTLSAGSTGGGAPAPPQAGFPQLIVEAGFYAAAPVATPGTLILDDPVAAVFDTGLLGDATAWTDITTYVRSGSVTRASTRVQGPLRTYQAGTASAVLDNTSGNFDPENLSGAFVTGGMSNIRPMIPVRVRAIYGSIEYHLFQGFADSWTETAVDYDAGWSEVTVAATDGFKILAGITLPATGLAGDGENSGNRIERILSDAGWYTDHRLTDTGDSELQGTPYGDTALNLMQLAADTEAGSLYMDGSGNVVFRRRTADLHDARSTAIQAVFGDKPVAVTGNWLLTPQNDFEAGGTFTWANTANSAVARTGTAFRTGTQSMSLTSAAAGTMSAAHCLTANIAAQGMPVNGGVSAVTCSAYVLTAVTSRSTNALIQWYDAGGALLSTSTGLPIFDVTASWSPITVTATAPATAAYCRAGVQVNSTGAGSEVHYVDDMSLTGALPELACAAVGRADDDTTLANDVQITRAGGNLQQAKSVVSIGRYLFPRSYARSDVLLESDAEAKLYAQWVLYVSLDGEKRFDTLVIDPNADQANLFPQVLGREIGDRIMVYRRPQNTGATISKPCFIRGITHNVDVTAGTWQTVWDLQDASKYAGFLILDDPVSGKVSGGNKLAF
jgi:hypothetical protein